MCVFVVMMMCVCVVVECVYECGDGVCVCGDGVCVYVCVCLVGDDDVCV